MDKSVYPVYDMYSLSLYGVGRWLRFQNVPLSVADLRRKLGGFVVSITRDGNGTVIPRLLIDRRIGENLKRTQSYGRFGKDLEEGRMENFANAGWIIGDSLRTLRLNLTEVLKSHFRELMTLKSGAPRTGTGGLLSILKKLGNLNEFVCGNGWRSYEKQTLTISGISDCGNFTGLLSKSITISSTGKGTSVLSAVGKRSTLSTERKFGWPLITYPEQRFVAACFARAVIEVSDIFETTLSFWKRLRNTFVATLSRRGELNPLYYLPRVKGANFGELQSWV